jgi:hypothetical protein
MNQALYAHMNNKRKMKKKIQSLFLTFESLILICFREGSMLFPDSSISGTAIT